MQLKHLRTFVAVADTLNLTRAGEKLCQGIPGGQTCRGSGRLLILDHIGQVDDLQLSLLRPVSKSAAQRLRRNIGS